jgi:hypothetical protein
MFAAAIIACVVSAPHVGAVVASHCEDGIVRAETDEIDTFRRDPQAYLRGSDEPKIPAFGGQRGVYVKYVGNACTHKIGELETQQYYAWMESRVESRIKEDYERREAKKPWLGSTLTFEELAILGTIIERNFKTTTDREAAVLDKVKKVYQGLIRLDQKDRPIFN